MFQAKLRGWRRLAAGLVLVPGLTGLGADALGLLGRAAGQDRPPAARTEDAREIMRRAREAYDAGNYGLARELAEKANSMKAPTAFYDDRPDELLGDLSRKPGGRPMAAAPATAAPTRPATTDPKVLLTLAKQAMDAGDLDRAQDLATQAQATGAHVRWGLFDDTPASVLKDIYKARGRRDRDMSEKLLTEARQLLERPAASKNERAANLGAAEEKARRAGAMHGPYSMWDFGDRPGDVIADVRKTREKERLLAVKPQTSDFPDEPMPKGPSGYAGRKQAPREDRGVAMDSPRQADAAAARKKAAIVLMQEGKAFEVGFHYAEARRKYAEAARLNAPFSKDEDTPESELTRLALTAQRHIDSLTAKARSCMDRKDQTAASAHLDEAHAIAIGMGLDATLVVEMRLSMKSPSGVVATGAKTEEGPAPVIRTGRRPMADETADVATPPVKTEDAPPPIIRTGSRPMTDETATSPGDPPPIIRTGRRPMADETADDAPKIKSGGPAPIIRNGNRPMPDETADVMPPPVIKPAAGDDAPKGAPIPLPPIPDVDKLADQAKPPKIVEPAPIIRSNPTPPMSDQGEQLLKIAREELRKGETETTKRICIEVINGPYSCKDEAVALLKTAETKEAEGKIASARRAFENGMDAYQAHNYAQALAIFQQIDGMLLPAEARKKLTEMTELAAAKKKEMDDATANRSTDKLPTAPKLAPGIPDVPPTGPAPAQRVGADNLLKQQEALAQVEFQRLRSKALKVESESTARFGRGETDAALQDLKNFCAEVKASNLEPSKQNMLVRPIEARMDRLQILKHQTDFLTKEAKDRRNFKTEMTHEALAKQAKQEDVAQLMKEATKLMAESKYKEAYVKVQMAHSMDPDDASVNGTMMMAEKLYRLSQIRSADKSQEKFNYERMNEVHQYPDVTDNDPLKWTDDKEYRDRVRMRSAGNFGVQRMRTEAEKSIERKMSTPVTVSFKSVPLEAVVEHLHLMTAINFELDLRALKEGSIDPKQPITTGELKDLSLKSALDIICRQAGLKHLIESEAIRITTPRAATGRQFTKTLSVGDLVVPAPNYGAHPGLTFHETMQMARDAAFGLNRVSNNNTMRTGPGSLPGGTNTGSMADLAGSPNRMTNTPMGGGASSNTGPTSGTLERELIRLITSTIRPDTWKDMGGEGTIEYYPLGLAMVINQSPEVIEEVERLLESLRKLQDLEVSIEVKVVSLAETFYERIGVDFAMGIPTNAQPTGGPLTGQTIGGRLTRNFSGNAVGLQLPGVPTPDLDIPIRPTSFARAIPPFGGFTNSFQEGGIALGLAFLSECQVQMFLEAAQGDTRTNVMQAPKLTALNGTSASMTVGDFQFFVTGITPIMVNGQMVFVPQNVPFLVGQTQPIPPNASIQNGLLNFTPTAPQTPGLGLFIQPVVSADRRFVRLNIQQSFTNLISGTVQTPLTTIITPQFENGGTGQPIPFTQFLQQPRFSNIDTQTVVVVPDGGTVVMGGLKYMTEGRNEFGPPVLSKIPYLNRLFKNVAYGREGRSILIMVTPRVIINREEQERQTGVREDDFVGVVGP